MSRHATLGGILLVALTATYFACYPRAPRLDERQSPEPPRVEITPACASPASPAPPGSGCSLEATAPRPSSSRPVVAPPAEESVRRQLREATRVALERVPSDEDLRALADSELHEMPAALACAGRLVDRVAAIAYAHAADPVVAAEAARFFGDCAARPSVATSLRVSCLRGLLDFGGQASERVPRAIVVAAARLPGIAIAR